MEQDFFERMARETGKVLSDVQRKAVLHTDGPLLLLATPGSGKTTTLLFKVAYLIIEKGVDPRTILGLTFSKASAREMAERFQATFSHLTGGMAAFSTIHSFAFKVVRDYASRHRLGYTIIEGETGASPQLNKKAMLRRLFEEHQGTSVTEDQMEELTRLISFAKNRMIPVEAVSSIETDIKKFPEIFRDYEAWKTRDMNHPLMDYDDMLTYANMLLDSDADLLSNYQRQFSHILTDESQDSSLIQHELIEKLARPNNNICVVADDDQTLYSWRGAEINKILHFKETYPDAELLYMEENYRSSKEIVEVANTFVGRNKNRYKKNMYTSNPSDQPPLIRSFPTHASQIDFVIGSLKNEPDLKETAILYRNNASSIPFINALDLAGIPFYMRDMDHRFFSHWVLKDIINFMRFAEEPANEALLERIHTKFTGYISKRQLSMISADPAREVIDRLLDLDMKFYQKKVLRAARASFRSMRTIPPQQMIRVIRSELDYEKTIKKMSDSLGFNFENLRDLLDQIETVAAGVDTVSAFEERILHLESLVKKSRFNQEHLTLSTLHSSKGLEFDSVYMVDLVNGVLPSDDNISQKGEGMEEAVRLFYVGMTRARKKLHLLSYRQKGGAKTTESLFLLDIKRILNRMYPGAKIDKPKPDSPFELTVGLELTHRLFGPGVVSELSGDVVRLQFDDGVEKMFSLQACIESDVLRIKT